MSDELGDWARLELVNELRTRRSGPAPVLQDIYEYQRKLAADRIEELEAALRPFAAFHVGVSAKNDAPAAFGVFDGNDKPLLVRDFRRAHDTFHSTARERNSG